MKEHLFIKLIATWYKMMSLISKIEWPWSNHCNKWKYPSFTKETLWDLQLIHYLFIMHSQCTLTFYGQAWQSKGKWCKDETFPDICSPCIPVGEKKFWISIGKNERKKIITNAANQLAYFKNEIVGFEWSIQEITHVLIHNVTQLFTK